MSGQKVCIRNNRELCRAVSFLRIYKKTVGRVHEMAWKNASNRRRFVVSLSHRTGPGFPVLKRKTKRPPFLEAAYAGVIVSNEIMGGDGNRTRPKPGVYAAFGLMVGIMLSFLRMPAKLTAKVGDR
jgi:hypothetical protein